MDKSKTAKAADLLSAQHTFAEMLGHFLIAIHGMGYQITIGDAYRDPRVFGAQGTKMAYSQASSAHKWRLAIDLCLFYAGRYLTETADYAAIGEVWERMGGTWGGKWGDGNHFSLTHGGVS